MSETAHTPTTPPAPTTPPILIVGAGPTGLTLALALTACGIACRIVDKAAERTQVSKALAVWSGSLEAFAGLGVARSIIDAGIRMTHMRVGDGGRELAAMPIAEGVDSAFPFVVIIPQSETERLLAEHLAARGVTIERGLELVAVDQTAHAVRAVLRPAGHDDDRADSAVTAAYVVGCDGARSAVRHAMDIPFTGYTEPQTFILSDTTMAGPLDPTSLYVWWGQGGSVALFPIGDGVWRTFAMRDDPDDQSPPDLEEMQAQLNRCGPPGLVAGDPTWLSAFRVNERLVECYRRGRVLLAGDAAHIHSPAGGQGMNTGIQDAVNLAWKLAAVLQGRGDATTLLDSYEAERRPVARQVIDGAAQKLHVGMVARGTATRLLRDVAVSVVSKLPMLRRKLQVELSETALRYDTGALISRPAPQSAHRHPAPGERALDGPHGEGPFWRHLSVSHHCLLVFADALPPALAQSRSHCGTAIAVVTVALTDDPDGTLAARYDARPGSGDWVLIRPDQFIGARGRADDAAAFDAYARMALLPAG